jgi:hypothetical protein
VKHLSGAPLWGRLLASTTKTRLGWKGLVGTNTIAYYENQYITSLKRFVVQAHNVSIAVYLYRKREGKI